MKEDMFKLKNDYRWDLLSLGEVLLRFDPGNEALHRARNFRVWDGGGEYNVAKNLSSVFGHATAIKTALTDNALGRLAEDFVRQSGVDTSQIIWRGEEEIDDTRNGIYFIGRGFGLRPPSSCFDRKYTAIAGLKTGEIDWNKIFSARGGTRWFHTGGVFAGLSDATNNVALEAMSAARASGAIVSYDLNYRDSLWKKRGGRATANLANQRLLAQTDVVFGIPDYSPSFADFDEAKFRAAAEKLNTDFPNLKIIAVTLREIHSASSHNLSAACFSGGEIFLSREYRRVEVFDRVGSGDAFASGLIHGILSEKGIQFALDCGTACAVLAMTSPGDNLTTTVAEIERLIQSSDATVIR